MQSTLGAAIPIETDAGPDGLHEPFDAAKTAEILSAFNRDGYALLPGVLSRDETAALREGIDRCFTDSKFGANLYYPSGFVLVRMFETSNLFRDLLVREPIISLAEKVLGVQCHIMAQNVVRNGNGVAISNFHVDADTDCGVEFPCPPDMARHDPRYQLPVFRMTVQIMLTDCESIEYGPTQFVPASHYAGRIPNDLNNPSFEGNEPVSVFCKAGDIYLHNGQCWHRGAPNTSDRTRYLLQHSFAQRWVSQRFHPFIDYQMPPHVWEGAGERLQRVLGRHPKGPYG